MLESKIFANGSTTLPKPVRDALGIKAGDPLRYVISDKGVHIEKVQAVPETAVALARSDQS
jgi:AbrB family looped-hinge helix DNA binding protein